MEAISVITPTVRPELLSIVEKSLKRQTFQDFEWIVVAPLSFHPAIKKVITPDKLIKEPPKRAGDYYGLNKAWNAAFRAVEGKLLVNVVDGLELQVDTLEKLWRHYEINPKACISCIGHQYKDLSLAPVWSDPRARTDFGSFYEVEHQEMEWCVASFPRQAVYDVGGIDEKYDKGAALGEKELMLRVEQAGYKLYLAQDIEYKAIQHPRLNDKWDEMYKVSTNMYIDDMIQIRAGKRLKLDYLNESDTI